MSDCLQKAASCLHLEPFDQERVLLFLLLLLLPRNCESAGALTLSLICWDSSAKSAESSGYGETTALTDNRIFSCIFFFLNNGELMAREEPD